MSEAGTPQSSSTASGDQGFDASPECLVARNTRLDELFVAQTFGDQDMRHRIEQRDVGPRLGGNNDVGVLREFARTGIDDDELDATLPGGTLEDRSGDGKLRLGLTPTTRATSAFSIWV